MDENLSLSHILVVDDNATNRNLLHELLNYWKVKHECVESGELALKSMHQAVAERNPFNIAILDMCMPEMDGVELSELILSDPKLRQTRTMLLTSQGRRGDANKMFKAGFSAYLSKPVDQSELYNSLLQLVGLTGDQERLITRYTANERKQFDAKVLLVEDNVTNQAVAKGVLDQFGLKTDIANNGKIALDMLNQSQYDLVFMDCQMPVMDGYEASEFIRQDESQSKNKSIPIVAMTANAMKGDREKCLASGMNDHIPKPINGKMILNALEEWLPKKVIVNNGLREERRSDDREDIVKEGENNEEVFDYEGLSHRMMDNHDLVATVIDTFIEDAYSLNLEINDIIKTDDDDALLKMLHRIKGSAANVGGIALSELAKRLEHAGKEGDFDLIRESQTKIELAFTQLIDAMKAKRTK